MSITKAVPSFFTAVVVFVSAISLGMQATISAKPANSNAIFQQAVTGLNLYKQSQQKAGLQDPDLAYAMRKSLVLAELLIDSTGKLNVSLCNHAKQYFVPLEPNKYEVNISNVLDQLDDSWQPFFEMVTKPHDPHNVANLVLRGLFGLRPGDTITDRHAKIAVLAAMFAPFNQGPVEDCFAFADLIRDHNLYYRHSAADYAAIVQSGYLTRLVGSQMDNFFFLPNIADDDREKMVTIDASGKIAGSNMPVFSTPGIAAACNLMGGNRVPNLAAQALKALLHGSAKPVQVTAGQVIHACAKVIAAQTKENEDALRMQGEYGFSSLTNNPVLRGTECAFAAMAEDRPDDSTRSNVNNCVMQALQSTWDAIGMSQQAIDFRTVFANNFNASYRLVYNADISLTQVSSDKNSSDGGFQLYKRLSNMSIVMGVPVETPEDFGKLVLDAIALTASQLGGTEDIQAIAACLSNAVQNGTFLRDALWSYDEANQQESDPVGNYQKLARTPMQSCDGDNPYEVDDTDAMFEDYVHVYTPSNTQDLLKWCLDMSRQVSPGLYPMNSPQHAFNYAPGNPDIAAFVQNGLASDRWIKQTLIIPGMKIAVRQIDTKTRTALSNAVLNIVSNAIDRTAFYRMVAKLNAKPMSTQTYAQGLVDGINRLIGDDSQAGQVAIIVDSVLLQVLPLQDFNMLEKTSIRFAFTNWNDGTKDIYFCAFFNPRTQKVSFGSIDEDKSNLQPMDEQAWVNEQQWDVDLRPVAPISLQKVS